MSTMTSPRYYPIPTRERRQGSHNGVVRDELMRAAGVIRFVATLIVQGGMDTAQAKFWMVATADYLRTVQRLDMRGVIR
jgi:hypothetical protein